MNTLKVGFADQIVTPKDPQCFFLDGYGFRMKPAESIRDDLHVKVCAISSKDETFLLFSLDLLGLRAYTYDLITTQITALTGVPKERMALVCTHTHAAPATGILNELPINYEYFSYVGESCGKAALRAMERACPGSFSFEILPETLQHSCNRRPGRDVIDRRIRAAAFRDESGTLRGVLCSAACHAVINQQYSISADWLSHLNAISSDELPYLYLQGRAADINPYFDFEASTDEYIRTLGQELSEPVRRAAQASSPTQTVAGELHWNYEYVRIPMMEMNNSEELQLAIKQYEDRYYSIPYNDVEKHYQLRELQWLRHMLRICERGETNDITVPLQYLAIGNACVFAFVPFELLTLTGNKLEEIFASAGYAREAIYICGYSNVTEGYLAPVEEFAFGGYEVSGASHWYNISQTCPESEGTVLSWFEKKAKKLS